MNDSASLNPSLPGNPVLDGIRRLAEDENLSPREAFHTVLSNGLGKLEAMEAAELRLAVESSDFDHIDEALDALGRICADETWMG